MRVYRRVAPTCRTFDRGRCSDRLHWYRGRKGTTVVVSPACVRTELLLLSRSRSPNAR